MSSRYLRVYQNLDVDKIRQHLLIYGDLSGNCANCQTIDIKLDTPQCPNCQTEFKYIAFRNIKSHLPKLKKLSEGRPGLVFVDHEDFKQSWAALKAEKFLR